VIRCPASVRLTTVDAAKYSSIVSNPLYDTSQELGCELGLHDDGNHVTEVQNSAKPGYAYWATWRGVQPYHIAHLPYCTAIRGDRDAEGQPVTCALYDGHHGNHPWSTGD
jgi:hypothetical protein